MINKYLSAWWWIPTLYFVEGIPYFVVNSISIMMFARLGVPNGDMALFTSLLYLPWTIKPLWSPFVDVFRTKRWWIIIMQVVMLVAFVVLSSTLPQPNHEIISGRNTPISLFYVTLVFFVITAFASATHDIAADGYYMLALDEKRQSLFVGIRSTFYRLSSIFGQGVLVFIAGVLEIKTGNIPLAWQLTLSIVALIFAFVSVYHIVILPKVEVRENEEKGFLCSKRAVFLEFTEVFVTYFRKKGVWLTIAFLLLYRLPEAFLIKMISPFLLDAKLKGGLELDTTEVGVIYGTVGILLLTLGGIAGGLFVARLGFRRSLWYMAGAMTLPCLTFVYLSFVLPSNVFIIGLAVAVEQFGYGFGFTAYLIYMMKFSDGRYKTAHYSICTAFMALSMMLPGMFAGYLQEWLGYKSFFLLVILCCIATLIVTFAINKDDEVNS